MDIRALLGTKATPSLVVKEGQTLHDPKTVKMQLLKCGLDSTVITQGNAALPHFKVQRLRTGWSPNKEQASIILESIITKLATNESPSRGNRLGYYRGGYFQKEGRETVLRDAEVAVSLGGTAEKINPALLELPRSMMDDSFPSSAASEHCFPRLLSPKLANLIPHNPPKLSRASKTSTSGSVFNIESNPLATKNKTFTRLLDHVNPELKERMEKAEGLKSQMKTLEVSAIASKTGKAPRPRGRPLHSRPLSTALAKSHESDRMRVTGTPWQYQNRAYLYDQQPPRPKTAAPKQCSREELSEKAGSSLANQNGASNIMDSEGTLEAYSPQVLKPRYQSKTGSPSKIDVKTIQVKIPTPKFRPCTVKVQPESAESAVPEETKAKHHRSSTLATTSTVQQHISEWSIRITPKHDGKRGNSALLQPTEAGRSQISNISSDVERERTEDRPSAEEKAKLSADRITPDGILAPKITFSKSSAADYFSGLSPTPSIPRPSDSENQAIERSSHHVSFSELNTSLAITVLKPRLAEEKGGRGEQFQNQSFNESYRHPEANSIFFEQAINAQSSGPRPQSGARTGHIRKGRVRLESAKPQGRQVRCVHLV